MYNEVLYHGTNRIRGKRILSSQRMEISTGDKHWLGDGSYFFDECLYAYKWIVDMRSQRHPGTSIKDQLESEYQILTGTVRTAKKRVFDLRKTEYKLIFDETYNSMEKMKEYSQRFMDAVMAEGVVINYLFNELDYYRDFDLVVAVFAKDREFYKGKKLRLRYIPQTQICIKNLDTVTEIHDYDYSINESVFQNMIEQLTQQKEKQPTYYSPRFKSTKIRDN